MNEKYYTVEKISEIIDMHPKTIQRFIREGKLRANKIGKGWRVSGHDLSVFIEGKNDSRRDNSIIKDAEAKGKNSRDRIMVSAVADIEVFDSDEASSISNTMTAILVSKDPSYGKSTITTQYIEAENKVRVMLWGTTQFIEAMMSSLNALTEDRG